MPNIASSCVLAMIFMLGYYVNILTAIEGIYRRLNADKKMFPEVFVMLLCRSHGGTTIVVRLTYIVLNK